MRFEAQQKAPPRPSAQSGSSAPAWRTCGSASSPHFDTIAAVSVRTRPSVLCEKSSANWRELEEKARSVGDKCAPTVVHASLPEAAAQARRLAWRFRRVKAVGSVPDRAARLGAVVEWLAARRDVLRPAHGGGVSSSGMLRSANARETPFTETIHRRFRVF